jgi:hypothetical protein
MALKADRQVNQTDISCFSNVVATGGQLAILKTSQASGHASGFGINDQTVEVTTQGTGTPSSGTRVIGVFLDDVVNVDQTKFHRNYQRVEQVVGENVCLLKDGWVVTDMITGTPVAGDKAYLGANSKFSPTQSNSNAEIGKFDTAKDAAGFAKVTIKVP